MIGQSGQTPDFEIGTSRLALCAGGCRCGRRWLMMSTSTSRAADAGDESIGIFPDPRMTLDEPYSQIAPSD